jgi:alkylation response protein AidB-like acyl-CoA dehydrogenase
MPEAYGGADADKLYSVVQIEELSRAGVTGIGYSLHSEIVAPYILHYGTEEQKQKYLPKLATGEMIGAIAMSEPAAGSDLQGIKTTAIQQARRQLPAQRQQDLHHQRLARRPGDRGGQDQPRRRRQGHEPAAGRARHAGLFEKGKRLKKLGLRAQDTSELFFDNVRVPAENLLGGAAMENRGFICLMEQLPWERLQIAITAVAAAQVGHRLDRGLCEGAQGVRPARGRVPEHPLHPGRAADRGAGGARVRRQVLRAGNARTNSTPPPPAWPSTGPPTCNAR